MRKNRRRRSKRKIKISAKGPSKTGCKLGWSQASKNANTLRKLEAITDIEKEQL